MRLTADPITPGSFAVRIWLDAKPGDGWVDESYNTVCNINRLNQYECEIAPCLGTLRQDVYVALGFKCLELGFKVMHFTTLRGRRVTRLAEHMKTVGSWDHYRVDLEKAAAEMQEGAR